jgi:transaldolase
LFKKIWQISLGVVLVLVGIVMLFTPGQGILAIVAGIVLISPYHGRRVIWRLKLLWKWVKQKWYSFFHTRVIKSKVWQKMQKLKKTPKQ